MEKIKTSTRTFAYQILQSICSAVKFYHILLNHPGKQRLLQGMHRHFHPDLRKIIDNFHCDACQKYKVDGRGFGHLPARDVRTAPWEQVYTDSISP